MADANRIDTIEYKVEKASNLADNNYRRAERLREDFEKLETDLSTVVNQTQLIYEYLIGNTKEDGIKNVIFRWGEKIEANEKSISDLDENVQRLIETKGVAHRSLWIAFSAASLLAFVSLVLSLSQIIGG